MSKPKLTFAQRWQAPSHPVLKYLAVAVVVLAFVVQAVLEVLIETPEAVATYPWLGTVSKVAAKINLLLIVVTGLWAKLSVNWKKVRRGPFLLLALLLLSTSGCMSYKKAQRRYATVAPDTVTVRVTAPADSARLSWVDSVLHRFDSFSPTLFDREEFSTRDLDHLRSLFEEFRKPVERTVVSPNGARVRYRREGAHVTATADCPEQTVETKVVRQVVQWGVAPKYKLYFHVTLGLLLFVLVVAALTYVASRFTFSVTRK